MSRRVALLSAASHLGGGERSLLDLARGLKRSPELGFNPLVILPDHNGALAGELEEAGVETVVVDMPDALKTMSRQRVLASAARFLQGAAAPLSYLKALRSVLVEREVALLHTNGIKCHALGAAVALSLKRPVLWHLRDMIDSGAEALILRSLGKIPGVHRVANSRATAEAFEGGPGGRTRVVHNGFDPAAWTMRPHPELKRRAGCGPGSPLVGIVGMLARWKGQAEFLEAAARLAAEGTAARFAVVGGEIYDTGADRGFGEELRVQARSLGLEDKVLFTGLVEDPAWALNGLDILVHASNRPEPFGRVIVEAMACGVPVVASAAGGVLEIVREGETGLLFKPGDSRAMAAAIRALVENEPRRKELARRGREDFLCRFTLNRHVEAMAVVYRDILAA